MKSVGIYMPAKNVSKYIKDAILSIMVQDYKDWVLSIIDDASDDDTYEEAKKIIDSRCILIRNESHCGLIGKLKNQSISLLPETKYICHVGSDDLIPQDCIKLFVSFMEKNTNFAAACGSFDCFNDDGNRWIFPHTKVKGFDNKILMRYMNFFPMRFYKKEAVMEVGGYSNILSSAVDYDLALKLDEKFQLGRIDDKINYHYRQHSTQVSTIARNEQDCNAKKALQEALDRRGLNKEVVNNAPPFILKDKESSHFIWGKK